MVRDEIVAGNIGVADLEQDASDATEHVSLVDLPQVVEIAQRALAHDIVEVQLNAALAFPLRRLCRHELSKDMGVTHVGLVQWLSGCLLLSPPASSWLFRLIRAIMLSQ